MTILWEFDEKHIRQVSAFGFAPSFSPITDPAVLLSTPIWCSMVAAAFLEVYVFQRLPCWIMLVLLFAVGASAQETRVVLDRGDSTIVLEPYAPNIIRVTLSLLRQPALAPPGYGFTGAPSATGWSHQQTEQGDTYRSGRMSVTVAVNRPGKHAPLPTQLDIAKYFNGSAPGAHITFSTTEGTRLLDMQGWAMAVPNHKDGTAGGLND